jgi:hypothetical protein
MYICDIISRSVIFRTRNASGKVGDKAIINLRISNFLENSALFGIMWKKIYSPADHG